MISALFFIGKEVYDKVQLFPSHELPRTGSDGQSQHH